MTVLRLDSVRKHTDKFSSLMKGKSVIETYRTFLIKLTAMGLTFVTSILIARLLGAEGYGTYAYALSWINLLSIIAVFGMDRLLLRETAVHAKNHNWSYLSGVLRWGNRTSALIAISLGSFAAFIAWQFKNDDNSTVIEALWIALILLPFMTLTALRAGTLQGLHKVALGQVADDLVRPIVYACLLIVAFLFYKDQTNPQLVMGFNVFAYICAFIAGMVILFKHLPAEVKTASPEYESKRWLKAAMILSFLGAIHVVNKEIRTLMLGQLASIEEVGIYTVAMRGAELIVLPINVINAVVASKFASLYANKDMDGLQRVLTQSTRVMLLISIPCAAVLIGFSDLILGIFGESFLAGKTTLAIMCIGSVISCGIGSVGLLLTMTGHESLAAKAIIYSLIANVVLNLILIPLWGVEGAAISSAVCLIMLTLCYAWWVYRVLGLMPFPFGRFGK